MVWAKGVAVTENNVLPLDGCARRAVDGDLVTALREHLPSRGTAERLAQLFRMLGDPNRVRILLALLEGGELCVCDLAAAVGSSESAASHALRLLRTASMVRSRRDGKRVFYALDDGHVRVLLDLSVEHVQHVNTAGTLADSEQEER